MKGGRLGVEETEKGLQEMRYVIVEVFVMRKVQTRKVKSVLYKRNCSMKGYGWMNEK